MTIQEAIRTVSHNTTTLLVVPKWFQRLPFSGYVPTDLDLLAKYLIRLHSFCRMTHIIEADEYLRKFMKAHVEERKAEIGSMTSSDRNAGMIEADVFTMLVEANEDDGGKFKLDDGELVRQNFQYSFSETLITLQIGNVFLMLLAGHGN